MCYGQLNYTSIYKMLATYIHTPELPDGSVFAKTPNSVVPASLLQEVMTWLKQGISISDAIDRLRPITVSPGYTPHPGQTYMYPYTWLILITCTICKWSTICQCFLYMFIVTIGMTESLEDKQRSIIVQLEFHFIIDEWERKGVPFRMHLDVPDIHPITKGLFCDMYAGFNQLI